jgi:hypothetical protein
MTVHSYLEELHCARSLIDVNFQTLIEEILKNGTQFIFVFNLRFSVRCYQIQRSKWIFIQVWRFALNLMEEKKIEIDGNSGLSALTYHFNGHDAERPQIDFWPVLLSCHDFRRPIDDGDLWN